MTDPIGDLLTRIRNAFLIQKKEIILPASKVKFNLLKILKKENFIKSVKKIKVKEKDYLKVELSYKDKLSVVQGLERVSKPGQRIYVKNKKIKPVLNGLGIGIISTSEGLLIDKEARKKGLGGEYVCKVW